MDPAYDELERRSRYLSSLVRRTRLADPPQPEPEPELKVEPKSAVDLKPAAEPSCGDGKGGKAEVKERAVKAKGQGATNGEERKVAVRVRAADMPLPLQRRAIWIAREVVLATPRLESKRLALALKKEFDTTYGPACPYGHSEIPQFLFLFLPPRTLTLANPIPMDDDVGEASPPPVPAPGPAPAPSSRDMAASPTSSRSVTETVNGSHRFVIQGYSLAKGMGVGKHIASETFTVGGYQWAIYFYPDGKNPEDNSAYVSVFIALASEGTDVRALFELTLQDQSGKGKHKVHSHFDRSLESGPYTLKYRGSMWGYKRFFRRTALETSDFLKDDCLKINCTVGVVVSTIDYSRPHSIQVPDSDIGYHFGSLLDSNEGVDVILNVGGERFHAHKLVLAARSSVFRSKLFDDELDGEKNEVDQSEDLKEIVIDDIEPKVFKAMLHFIYRDSLVDDCELDASSSGGSIFDTLAAKLLAAADKYDLARLKLLCESYLCKGISVVSVASTLALADSHHAMELKTVCLKFAAENLSAVIRTEGFDYLKDNCPSLQSEILRTVAGCEEPCSSGGKSQSVWGQLSDGGDTSGRRVRPRI